MSAGCSVVKISCKYNKNFQESWTFFCVFHQNYPKISMVKVTVIYYIIVKTKGTDLEKPKIAIPQHWIEIST